jgi:hypothetical protein
MNMKKMMAVVCVLAASAVGFSLAADAKKGGPSIYIQPCVAHDPVKNTAYIKPDKNDQGSAKFMVKIGEAPAAHEESVIEGPVFAWTLAPVSPNASITPAEGDSTVVSLSGAGAWDKLYTLSVTATWMQVNQKTGARTPVTVSASITVSSSKK